MATPADSNELADLREALETAVVLRDVSRPKVTGSSTATLSSYRNVLGTRNVGLTVRGVTLSWNIDTGASLSVVTQSAARRMRLAVRDTGARAVG